MNDPIKALEESDALAATRLKNDPRVAEAKRLLLAAVEEHRQAVTGPRPPNPDLTTDYDALLTAFAEVRGGTLWYPYIGSGIGNGSLVELLDGSVKYDGITGIGPHYLGHSNADLIGAAIDAAIGNTVMQGHLQQNSDSIRLCQLLLEISGLSHCFLTSSGVMANENALKIAFQKRAPATRLFAFERCFAGRTLAFAQVTDKAAYRDGLPSTLTVDYVPFYDPEHPDASIKNALAAIKQAQARYPGEHAAMIFELVQGEAGSYPGSHAFFDVLMRHLKASNVAIIVDEVQTFGRTMQPFAFQHFQLEELVDIVTIGKLSQVCATLFRSEYAPRPGLLSQTFTASTTAIRCAYTLIKQLLDTNFFGRNGKIAAFHTHFCDALAPLQAEGLIHGPFGIGAMVAFTPLDGSAATANACSRALFDAGVIAFTAGNAPSRIRFLMPVGSITREEIDDIVAITAKVLRSHVSD